MSTKTIVTSKTLLDGTDEIALAPDGSDYTGDHLGVWKELELKGSMLSEQVMLPPITDAPTNAPTAPTNGIVPNPPTDAPTAPTNAPTDAPTAPTNAPTNGTPTPATPAGGTAGTGGSLSDGATVAHCTTVCNASFYIKTEVATQDLGYMVINTLAATASWDVA